MALFEHYAAHPGAVNDAGRAIITTATRIEQVTGQVDASTAAAERAVTGVLTPSVASAPSQTDTLSHQTTQTAHFAGGVVALFADDIQTYNDGIDKLNARYDAAAADSFGVDVDSFYLHGSQTAAQRRTACDHAISAARSSLVATLRAEKHALDLQLDTDAEHAAAMLKAGPTPDAVYELVASGALPVAVAMTFPGVDLAVAKDLFKAGKTAYKLYSKVLRLHGNVQAAKLAVEAWKEMDTGRSMIPFARTFDDVVDVFGQLGDDGDYMALYAQMRNAEWLSNAARAGIPLSKFAKGLAGAGILAGGYDLFANPDGHQGARRGVDIGMDVAGMGASGAGLAVALGLVSVTPVGMAVIVGAGAVTAAWAAGNYVYDHWDDITQGAEAAKNWMGDRASDVMDVAGDGVNKAKDLVDDVGDGAKSAWHSVFG